MSSLLDVQYYKSTLKQHILHFIINSPLLVIAIFFYTTFGFYGWQHLLSLAFIAYSAIALDNYMDSKQRFPCYIVPLLCFSAFFYPVITGFALVGCLIINLRAIAKSDSFVLERLEGVGMLPLAVFPYVLPLNIFKPEAFAPAFLFVMAIDSFHKIGHKETKNVRLMWISGISFILLVMGLYAHTLLDFLVVIFVILAPLIGLKLVENYPVKYSKAYYQIWQTIVIIVLFAKYPEYLLVNFYK